MGNLIGKTPRYPTGELEKKTLSMLQYEAEQEELKGKPKKRKAKKKKFVSCSDCKDWVTSKVVDGKIYGKCDIGIGHCSYL